MQDKAQIRFRILRSQEALPDDVEVIHFLGVTAASLRDVDQKGQPLTKGNEDTVLSWRYPGALDYFRSSQSKILSPSLLTHVWQAWED